MLESEEEQDHLDIIITHFCSQILKCYTRLVTDHNIDQNGEKRDEFENAHEWTDSKCQVRHTSLLIMEFILDSLESDEVNT
jgi:hypothetical protein